MYYNSRVILNGLTEFEISSKVEIYSWLGYDVLFYESNLSPSQLKKILAGNTKIRKCIQLVPSCKIESNNLRDLKKKLAKYSQDKEKILAVGSMNTDVINFAAHDSRVSVISAVDIKHMKVFTEGTISLIKQYNKTVEISLIDSLTCSSNHRSRVFREIGKFLNLVKKIPDQIIYAGNEQDLKNIRGPRELISIFRTVFDMNKAYSNKIFTKNPERIHRIQTDTYNGVLIGDAVKIVKKQVDDRDA